MTLPQHRIGNGLAGGVHSPLRIDDSGVDTNELADGSVTTAKIAASAVTTAKIADDTITANDVDSSSFLPLIGEDLAALTDKTTHGTTDGATYEQWGTEEATVTDPNVNVIVWARLFGDTRLDDDAGENAFTTIRLQISLDGGSTWSNGTSVSARTPSNNIITMPIANVQRLAGTPTGDIQARAQVVQGSSSSGAVSWRSGQIELKVYQNE